jgi:hypothetical protein
MLTLPEVLSPDALLEQIRTRYGGLVQTTTWLERVLVFNPGGAHPHGVHFLSITERDGGDDAVSRLMVNGAYCVNVALTPLRYHACFGAPPERTLDSRTADATLVTDALVPHPVYAWKAWAAIVNPTAATLERLWPVLDESYALARRQYAERAAERAVPGRGTR